jgi:hypothetical protein
MKVTCAIEAKSWRYSSTCSSLNKYYEELGRVRGAVAVEHIALAHRVGQAA